MVEVVLSVPKYKELRSGHSSLQEKKSGQI